MDEEALKEIRELNENLKWLRTPNPIPQTDEEKIAEYSRVRKEKTFKKLTKGK